MDINKYIKELIIKNECIILSGFGGFETHYIPAHLDGVTGKMVPPSKQVIFRQDFKKDNRVLARFVAKKEGIDLDKATEVIDDFISDIVYKLDTGGSYILDGLGKFIKEHDGRLIFIPLEKQNFLIDSFGLSEISIPDKERPEDVVVEEEKQVMAPGKKHSTGLVYLILLLIVVLSGLVFLTFKFDLFNKIEHIISGIEIGKKKTPEKIVFGHKIPPTNEDSIASAISENIDKSTEKEEALFYQEQEPEKLSGTEVYSAATSGNEKKYVIVAGSFRTETNAVDLSNQLRYKGFKPTVIQTENGLYRVVLDTFEEINLALDELEKYKKQLDGEIWILRI